MRSGLRISLDPRRCPPAEMNDRAYALDLFHAHLYEARRLASAFDRTGEGRPFDFDELHAVALDALWSAAQKYPGDSAQFARFARQHIRWDLRDALEKERRRSFKREPTSPNKLAATEPDFETERLLRKIRDALPVMPQREREAIAAILDGEPHEALARRQGVTPAAVSQAKKRALVLLRTILRD